MSSKDLNPEHAQLIKKVEAAVTRDYDPNLLGLLKEVAVALAQCPRWSCAYCLHVARNERNEEGVAP